MGYLIKPIDMSEEAKEKLRRQAISAGLEAMKKREGKVKETGIIMSGDHPKLILEGLKTQTRRVIKPQPRGTPYWADGSGSSIRGAKILSDSGYCDGGYSHHAYMKCPYGQVGDRLWVRETWRPAWAVNPAGISGSGIQYKSDGIIYGRVEALSAYPECQFSPKKWHPSIHMPRWASRITLEITEVRVERVQEIDSWDCIYEGIRQKELFHPHGLMIDKPNAQLISEFQDLWDSLNAKRGYGWDFNPWVWPISFKLIEKIET